MTADPIKKPRNNATCPTRPYRTDDGFEMRMPRAIYDNKRELFIQLHLTEERLFGAFTQLIALGYGTDEMHEFVDNYHLSNHGFNQ